MTTHEPFSVRMARLERARREPPVESPAWALCTQLCRGQGFRTPCRECVAETSAPEEVA